MFLKKTPFNPKNYENQDAFEPERWLGDEKSKLNEAYIPFSIGPRNCIGQHFAQMETKVILMHLLRKYDYSIKVRGRRNQMEICTGLWTISSDTC